VCVCPGPDRCLLPNVARHTAGGTEQAVTQRPQAGREGPRHLRTWCKRTHSLPPLPPFEVVLQPLSSSRARAKG